MRQKVICMQNLVIPHKLPRQVTVNSAEPLQLPQLYILRQNKQQPVLEASTHVGPPTFIDKLLASPASGDPSSFLHSNMMRMPASTLRSICAHSQCGQRGRFCTRVHPCTKACAGRPHRAMPCP